MAAKDSPVVIGHRNSFDVYYYDPDGFESTAHFSGDDLAEVKERMNAWKADLLEAGGGIRSFSSSRPGNSGGGKVVPFSADVAVGSNPTCADCQGAISGYTINGKTWTPEMAAQTAIKKFQRPLCGTCTSAAKKRGEGPPPYQGRR